MEVREAAQKLTRWVENKKPGDPEEEPTRPKGQAELDEQPRWDADLRKLWLGEVLLLHFKYWAETQEALIGAFVAKSWK